MLARPPCSGEAACRVSWCAASSESKAFIKSSSYYVCIPRDLPKTRERKRNDFDLVCVRETGRQAGGGREEGKDRIEKGEQDSKVGT